MSDSHSSGLDSTDQQAVNELLREFEENPFEAKKTPADVMRIFFQFNVPILPVVSRRGILIGIITKEAITAEMSDLDRCNELKIDEFVIRVAKPMSFESILPYVSTQSTFSVINIFGEVQGSWSRLDLIRAVDAPHSQSENTIKSEVDEQLEHQSMEWMIYFILEHIPRALYAMNTEGKTIFFNSYFEELVLKAFETDEVDVVQLERILGDKAINDVRVAGGRDGIVTFFNRRLEMEYEKVPMYSRGVAVGYLIYVGENAPAVAPGLPGEGLPLKVRMNLIERQIVTETLQHQGMDIAKTARSLGVATPAMKTLVKRLQIEQKNITKNDQKA